MVTSDENRDTKVATYLSRCHCSLSAQGKAGDWRLSAE
ncbi:hypothetical protein I553_8704 [Mycobacterium xenopi 4042]|uniref:Uncharacterized protein n=1 Tax=Mycobacterium xenopi 4042 TaxID=1299334 RepID=X8CJV6_MYCXE|nr:hypothetical protein I553_8704 [Mycobacterium xenopi 4042]